MTMSTNPRFESSNKKSVVAIATFMFLLSSDSFHTARAFLPRHQSSSISRKQSNRHAAYLDTDFVGGSTAAAAAVATSVPTTTPKTKKTSDNNLLLPTVNNAVDTTTLGNLVVPQVGVGTISWSTDSAADRRELETIMSHASQHPSGLLLDTAERYGSNLKTALGLGWGETEQLTRQLLAREEKERDYKSATRDAVIATKFTPSPWRTTIQSVVDACEQSRARLYGPTSDQPIDLYQLHMPDIVQPFGAAPKDKMYWDGLAECYHRGLVKNVGVCNYGPTLLMQCQEHLAQKGVPLASNQIAYSLLGRENGSQATLDKCQELGIQTLAFFPFAMGLLTGKYNSNNKLDKNYNKNNKLSSNKRSKLEQYDLYRYALGDGDSIPKGGIQQLLTVMEDIALEHGDKTVAQVALNYIICKGAIPIPGARTQGQYLDNMGAMGWRLSQDEIGQLENESDKLGFQFEGAGFKRTSEKFVGYGVEKWTLD